MSSKNPRPSRRAKELLAEGEGQTVDYKTELSGLTVDDLCAFANTSVGGTILVGVAEAKDEIGRQVGQPIGCPVDDGTKLTILNKAQSCHPPIPIGLHVERSGDLFFLRVEIPASETRPHCTPKGAYTTRVGSRNAPLVPSALLAIFIEQEANAFQARFTEATNEVAAGITETARIVRTLRDDIGKRIEDISNELGWSDMMFDDTGDKIDRVEAVVSELLRRSVDSATRLREIAIATVSADPIKDRARNKAREALKKALLENLEMIKKARTGDKISAQVSGELNEELSQQELQEIFSDVLKEILPGLDSEANDDRSAESSGTDLG